MKGFLSIFRKSDGSKDGAAQSRLTTALYGSVSMLPAPPPIVEDLPRARLVFAFDATASREDAWASSVPLTDALLAALPGQLDVALAVHGGSKVHTFTDFERDASKLRDQAARVRCVAGGTRLLDILDRVLRTEGVSTVVYVGDVFEESEDKARDIAASLATRKIRLIILHDTPSPSPTGIFAEISSVTGGCVLPFNASALPRLRDLLSAVAVLAVGGIPLLAAKQETMPAAGLLLQYLEGGKP